MVEYVLIAAAMEDKLLIPGARLVSYDDFMVTVNREQPGCHSRDCRPLAGEVAWQGQCKVAQLLAIEVHPVWYVDEAGNGSAAWNGNHARRILYRKALRRPDFTGEFREIRHGEERSSEHVEVIALHCTTCGNAALIDGNHRLKWLAANGYLDATVTVTGLSGSRWRLNVPDMNLICGCLSPRPQR